MMQLSLAVDSSGTTCIPVSEDTGGISQHQPSLVIVIFNSISVSMEVACY